MIKINRRKHQIQIAPGCKSRSHIHSVKVMDVGGRELRSARKKGSGRVLVQCTLSECSDDKARGKKIECGKIRCWRRESWATGWKRPLICIGREIGSEESLLTPPPLPRLLSPLLLSGRPLLHQRVADSLTISVSPSVMLFTNIKRGHMALNHTWVLWNR